jgi:ribose-phosphate pyrophosphokinase
LHFIWTQIVTALLGEDRKEFGAKSISLICLYMRQDKAFNTGESVTSTYFANLISGL